MKDYYGILQVNLNASDEIIKNSYELLYSKYSKMIEKNSESEELKEKLQNIVEAYKVLTNHEYREEYDRIIQSERENVEEDIEEIVEPKVIKKKHHKGTFGNIWELIKSIFKKRTFEKNKIVREDIIAAIITLVIVIALGLILWNIPVTNNFIKKQVLFIF